MNKIAVLEAEYNFQYGPGPVWPVLLQDECELVLVDCGPSVDKLRAAANANGINLDRLTKIIITHHDHDHIAGLAECKKSFPNVQILASNIEADYISGKKESVRLQQVKKHYDMLPADKKHEAENLIKYFKAVSPIEVDVMLNPPQPFPWCGGIDILPTPGHLPGHISVYAKEFKTLITGDALNLVDGRLIINKQFTLDMETARQSVRRLLDLDIQKIVCYHGGVLDSGIKEALKSVLEE